MARRMNTKSVILGVVLGGGLCVLIGAAANTPDGPVGRFQVACTQNSAYLVDTMTGQVWHNSERDFRSPKIRTEPAMEPPPAATAPGVQTPPTFIGKWVLTHPTEGQLGIQIEPDGRAILTEGQKSWEGKWQIEGNQITVNTEQETVTARIDEQGRLLVKEGTGEPIPFRRAQ